ncbi:hypothetical protein DRW03_13630 [Corallococcus sp. H22C18031201]|nr:hypothetical protein DRW03_13630 [Corallococcus sp. H22C18031201]
MSDFSLKPDAPAPLPSPAESTPPEHRRRGRVLLAATAASAAITLAACEPFMTTNPAPCVYDAGLVDCDPSGNPQTPDAGADAGTDAGPPSVP